MNNVRVLTTVVRAELRGARTVAVVLTLLIALVAALASASVLLLARTQAATARLWQEAQPPDVVQMSSGPLTPAETASIAAWAGSRDDVTAYQVSRTLPVAPSDLWIDGVNQADSVLDPAFVTQNPDFDILVGQDGAPVDVEPGEVALPVHYLVIGQAALGDRIEVRSAHGTLTLTVTAFVRDAQMNPSVVTSKRLLVSASDFARLDEVIDSEEQLIEFRTTDSRAARAVLDAYTASGLPARGVAVDASVLRLMNGLSVYLVVAVTLLVALLILAVAATAVRLAVLAAVEEDLPQLAALRAVGAPRRTLYSLVLSRYVLLGGCGGLLGTAAGPWLAAALGDTALVYLGTPPTTPLMVAGSLAGVVAVVGAVVLGALLALRRHLSRPVADMLASAEAGGPRGVRSSGPRTVPARLSGAVAGLLRRRPGRRRGTGMARTLTRFPALGPTAWLGIRSARTAQGALLAGVVAVAIVLMVLPVNVLTTLTDPRFSTYLGVGEDVQVRIDIRPGAADPSSLTQTLREDPRVPRLEVREAARWEVRAAHPSTGAGSAAAPAADDPEAWTAVPVEVAHELVFPPHYEAGRSPQSGDEIALSYNQAKASGVAVGDEVLLRAPGDAGGETVALAVVGVYSDLMNGGSTATMVTTAGTGAPDPTGPAAPGGATPLWHVVNVALADGVDPGAWAEGIRAVYPGAKVTLPAEFGTQTVGSTVVQVRVLTLAAVMAGTGVVLLVTVLSTVLSLERARPDLVALRSVGASRAQRRRVQVVRAGIVAASGIAVGEVVAAAVGHSVLGAALGALGAPGIGLFTRPLLVAGALPALLAAAVLAGTALALPGRMGDPEHPGRGRRRPAAARPTTTP